MQCIEVLDAANSNRLLHSLSPSISFFEHLAPRMPQLELDDIKDFIENQPHPQSMTIFDKIEDAIQKEEVAFTLNCKLEELKRNKEHWNYIGISLHVSYCKKSRTCCLSGEIWLAFLTFQQIS